MLWVSESFIISCGTSKITNWNSLETPETLCVLVSKLPGGLKDRWNRTVQGTTRSYGRGPCLSDFSRFVKEETILVNDPIFSREAVQEYVTHPEKKLNDHKKIGNFANSKHDLDDCKSFKEKGLRKEAGFYLSISCAMAVFLQYLLVTTQEIVRKGKNAKSVRKDS